MSTIRTAVYLHAVLVVITVFRFPANRFGISFAYLCTLTKMGYAEQRTHKMGYAEQKGWKETKMFVFAEEKRMEVTFFES